jgi:DNA-binding NtrC family response regulator
MIEKDRFRKDLYFRLGVIKVQVPSLNERRDDILPITRHFLYKFSHKFGKTFTGISPQTESALMAYNWTGNVRELKNIIERGVLIGKGPELEDKDLGIKGSYEAEASTQLKSETAFPPLPTSGIDLSALQESLNRHYIEAALKLATGNESKAAKLLNMNHHTFRYHNKKLQTK